MNKIILSEKHKKQVIDILNKYLEKGTVIYAFGSRTKNTTKEYADLDLALDFQNQKIEDLTIDKINADLSNSTIPITVDIIDYNDIAPSFKKIIENDLVFFYET